MSNSGRPHRGQPTRLLCPWDSPGKNTGVGCHFLLQCVKVESESEVAQSCPTFHNPMDCVAYQAPLSMGFSRQEYWSGCHCLLCQEIEMLKEGVCAQSCPTLCEHMDCGPPGFSVHGILQTRILQWVGISFSRESTQGSNPCLLPLLHWQAGYQLSHWGSPKGRPLPEKRPEEGMTDEEGQTAPP